VLGSQYLFSTALYQKGLPVPTPWTFLPAPSKKAQLPEDVLTCSSSLKIGLPGPSKKAQLPPPTLHFKIKNYSKKKLLENAIIRNNMFLLRFHIFNNYS
jgi:hypothetical protein